MDTKSPGDGRSYSVGTIEIRDTVTHGVEVPEFSGVPVGLPMGLSAGGTGWTLPVVGSGGIQFVPKRQVVILQCADQFGGILWQQYYYGDSSAQVGDAKYRRSTNARGVSVWPATSPGETRIAICGEQNDDILPLSQAPAGWVVSPPATPAAPYSGFVAVYDGFGTLLWSHHFFGSGPATDGDLHCAITDVSVRVKGAIGQQRDVVTYCGISNLGDPVGGNAWLTPKRWFATPPGLSDGTTDHGAAAGEFDGFVGRISRDHLAPLQGWQQEFHAVVAGSGSDGLFGIAELDDERFVTVGSTTQEDAAAALTFPFIPAPSPPAGASYRVGTLLQFDAMPTTTGGNLVLEFAMPLGTRGEHPAPIVAGTGKNTIARDVLVHLDGGIPGIDAIDVVGATDDAQFFQTLIVGGLQSTAMSPFDFGSTPSNIVPPSEGFYLSLWTSGGSFLSTVARTGGFIGGPGVDGLTGVSAWNEYPDQVQVCGYTRPTAGDPDADILVASLLVDSATTVLRRTQWGGTEADLPAAMGPRHVEFVTGLGPTDSHGSHAGGGISVDPRARMTVVGATNSLDYPVTLASFQALYGVPRSNQIPVGGTVRDAVRTEFDMLPEGVGRTDGSGSMFGPVPASLPPTGVTGGTTPVASLSPFGRRVNEVPLLRRTLVEFEGDNVVGATPTIVFSRPSLDARVLGTVLQFGFPVASPFTLDGVDYWLLDPSATMWIDPWGVSPLPWEFAFTLPLGAVAGTTEISAQLISLILCDAQTWQGSPCALNPTFGVDMALVGSPALYFQF